MQVQFSPFKDGFQLDFAGRTVLRHDSQCPALVIARGKPSVEMYRGNFRIEDAPCDTITPTDWRIDDGEVLLLHDGAPVARIALDQAALTFQALDPAFDRLWVHFHAEPGETIWGGGEQMSYLALNGRRFPMWTSEPGVGRDKTT